MLQISNNWSDQILSQEVVFLKGEAGGSWKQKSHWNGSVIQIYW